MHLKLLRTVRRDFDQREYGENERHPYGRNGQPSRQIRSIESEAASTDNILRQPPQKQSVDDERERGQRDYQPNCQFRCQIDSRLEFPEDFIGNVFPAFGHHDDEGHVFSPIQDVADR